MTNQWVPAERFGQIEVRPYEHGDQARNAISISEADLKLPTLVGGFVARNPDNHDDQWYIARDYFNKHYRIPVEPAEALKGVGGPMWIDDGEGNVVKIEPPSRQTIHEAGEISEEAWRNLNADAARYRWLRSADPMLPGVESELLPTLDGTALDDGIDAAMAAPPNRPAERT